MSIRVAYRRHKHKLRWSARNGIITARCKCRQWDRTVPYIGADSTAIEQWVITCHESHLDEVGA